MEIIQNINFNYLIVTGLLIILGLYLEKWQPPIKKQYVALALFAVGSLLGWCMIQSWAYGVLIAGVVYYKRELVEEIKEIKDCFIDIKETSDKE